MVLPDSMIKKFKNNIEPFNSYPEYDAGCEF